MKKAVKWLIILIILAGLGYGAWTFFFRAPQEERPMAGPVEVQVELHDFTSSVLATGTVKPKVGAQVNVGARVSGRVQKLSAGIGDLVEKDQVLAIIEHDELLSQVTQRESQLNYLEVQLASEREKEVTDIARSEATLAQRKVELETEQKRLETIRETRKIELDTERKRLDSIRAQGGAELALAAEDVKVASSTADYTERDRERYQRLYEKEMLAAQTLDRADTDAESARRKLKSSKKQKTLVQTRLEHDLRLQEELVKKAEAGLVNEVMLQEELVKKAEAAKLLAEADLESVKVSAKAAIAKLEAQIPQARAELNQTRIQLSYATVRATISGVIGTISTQEGETVAAGFSAPTFVTIVDLDRLQVDAYVDEVDIGKVKEKQRAVFTVDAYPGVDFQARVAAIYPSAIIQDNVVYYDVVLEIESDFKGKLRPDMTANVTVETESRKGVPAVPLKALRRKAGVSIVTVKTDQGPKEREVTAGLEDDDFVEIVSGLAPGETVIYQAQELGKKASAPMDSGPPSPPGGALGGLGNRRGHP